MNIMNDGAGREDFYEKKNFKHITHSDNDILGCRHDGMLL